jgi:hypothetical protein
MNEMKEEREKIFFFSSIIIDSFMRIKRYEVKKEKKN